MNNEFFNSIILNISNIQNSDTDDDSETDTDNDSETDTDNYSETDSDDYLLSSDDDDDDYMLTSFPSTRFLKQLLIPSGIRPRPPGSLYQPIIPSGSRPRPIILYSFEPSDDNDVIRVMNQFR